MSPSNEFAARNANAANMPSMKREQQVRAWLQDCFPEFSVCKFGMSRLSEDVPLAERVTPSFVNEARRPDLAIVPRAWDGEDLAEVVMFVEVKAAKLFPWRGWLIKPADRRKAQEWQRDAPNASYCFAMVTQAPQDSLVAILSPQQIEAHLVPVEPGDDYPSGTAVVPLSYLARPLWRDMAHDEFLQQRASRPAFLRELEDEHWRGSILQRDVASLNEEDLCRLFDEDGERVSAREGPATPSQKRKLSEIAAREGVPVPLVISNRSASQAISAMPRSRDPDSS